METTYCLTIAGSDPSSGAGIQADLRTFGKFEVYPFSIITAITYQTADSFSGYFVIPFDSLEEQLRILFEKYPIKYAKTGMIPTKESVKIIAKYLNEFKINYIVDPVTVASVGVRLAEKSVESELKNTLFPNAQVITPNVNEAEVYSGIKIKIGKFDNINLMKKALSKILEMMDNEIISHKSKAVIIKGANPEKNKILDLALIKNFNKTGKKQEIIEFYKDQRVIKQNIHGSGCVFSAALVASLAIKKDLHMAIKNTEQFFDESFESILQLGDIGQVISLEYSPEKKEVINQVKKIYDFIISSSKFSRLIPEVRTNISVAMSNAQSKNEIAAIEGRISIINGYPKAIGNIKFGVSDHTARLILTAKKFDNSLNVVINMKYLPDLIQKLEQDSFFKVVEFHRSEQPPNISLKEESTMQWVIKNVFEKYKIIPDIIWDKGALGKEPIMRLLAKDATNMIMKLQKILYYLK
jgi:hydroxymethylpyrimidine kinase/phosphomethylpyrimidine kinase